MKLFCYIFLYLSIQIPFLLQAQDFENFEVKGSGMKLSEKAYLLYYPISGENSMVDSAVAVNGTITFKGKREGPAYAGLLFGNDIESASAGWIDKKNKWFTLFSGETNFDLSGETPEIKGENRGIQLKENYESLKKKALNEGQSTYDVLLDFISKYPNEAYSLYLVLEYVKKSGKNNIEASAKLYDALDARLKGSRIGNDVKQKLASYQIKVGSMALDFSQADPNGKMIALKDYNGKYVLIDFWASWCAPCRAENPNLLKAYHAFKNRNFDVLGISIDTKKENWLKAIADDQLEWKHVSDLKGWGNNVSKLYGITGVPTNYLIDPKGKIVAINLRGADLQLFLENNLPKK